MATTNPPAKGTYVDAQGDVYVDGIKVTPAQASVVARDVDAVWREVSNKANWNWKQIEKGIIYVAAFISTTNVLGQIPVPGGVKEWVLGGSAFVLGLIHISSPKVN